MASIITRAISQAPSTTDPRMGTILAAPCAVFRPSMTLSTIAPVLLIPGPAETVGVFVSMLLLVGGGLPALVSGGVAEGARLRVFLDDFPLLDVLGSIGVDRSEKEL